MNLCLVEMTDLSGIDDHQKKSWIRAMNMSLVSCRLFGAIDHGLVELGVLPVEVELEVLVDVPVEPEVRGEEPVGPEVRDRPARS